MRLVAALLIWCVAAVVPGGAQQRVGPDGFSICPVIGTSLGPCEPLTDASMQKYGVTADQANIAAILKRLTVNPEDGALFDELAKSFAQLQLIVSTPDISSFRLPERDSDGLPSRCFVCGIQFVLSKDQLVQLTYGVQGKYWIIWSLVYVAKPAQ
jgi:hypothetical protein